MKHLFYIHNFISYIVSISIIKYKKIDINHVIFIYGRHFNINESDTYKVIRLQQQLIDLSQIPSYGEKFLLFKKIRSILKFNALLIKLMENKEFIAYLPAINNYLLNLIATNKLCRGIVFIEEGLLTYRGDFFKAQRLPSNVRERMRMLLSYPNHLGHSLSRISFPYPFPVPVYTLFQELASDARIEVHVLPEVVVPAIANEFLIDGACLLLIDPVVEWGIVTMETLLSAIEELLDSFDSHSCAHLWLRFHPVKTDEEVMTGVLDLIGRKSLPFGILPKDVCVEAILLNCANLKVYGFHSSLLFYASLWGHGSYSLIATLERLDPHVAKKYSTLRIPDVFFRKVQMWDRSHTDTRKPRCQ